MSKSIIATTLSGLFISSEPWEKAHELWFETWAEKLDDLSILNWIDKPNYFEGVDLVMQIAYPKFTDEQRIIKARETYFDSIIQYIKQNKQVVNLEIAEYFKSLKEKYQLALITTNTQEVTNRILSITNLENLFDIIETSLPEEKDDKILVFNRFIKKHGKPLIYIGGGRKDSYNYCKENNILKIFANLENSEEIDGVKSIHNLEELKEEIGNLN